MTSALRRAGGFAGVSALALAAPTLGRAAAVPFAAVAVLAAFVITDGPLFELFARPGDRRDGRLNGLAGFALAAAGLALLATVPRMQLPVAIFTGSVVLLGFGNLGEHLVRETTADPFHAATGFVVAGFAAGTLGQATAAYVASGAPAVVASLSQFAFLAAIGALVAALLRTALYERDDPLVLLSVGLALWVFDTIPWTVAPLDLGVALAVTVALGYTSYSLGTASVPGMLTGVLLSLLTIVLGGFGWFAVLIAFFAVGGLSTKFRYEAKKARGVAEENEGARGSGNVLGNAAVALVAVVGFAASPLLPIDGVLFRFAFAGSLATAMSDTLSSELGGLFDQPRLITTLEPVPPGTDGGVTWQGELAGVGGALVVAVLAFALMSISSLTGAALVVVGGVVGMTVDSLLGATVEGGRIGNQSVNLLATLAGAIASTALAILVL